MITTIIIVILTLVIIYQDIKAQITARRHYGHIDRVNDWHAKKESEWAVERQQLLDRIQAPSFDHLKNAEVRIIKAQKEELPIKYDLV